MPFIVTTRDELMHSAKGSTWKDHKYIKKVGDKYVYATTKGKAANAGGIPKSKVGSKLILNGKTVVDAQSYAGNIATVAGSKAAYAEAKRKQAEEEKEKTKAAYAKKVAANNAATSALSKVGKTAGAKDTGKKKSTSNYNKSADAKTKAAKTVNDLINNAVAASKKKKKKK